MTQAKQVRAWARDQGYEIGNRGIIAPHVWEAFSAAHEGVSRELPTKGAVGQCKCGRHWGGHRECHCTRCHRQFSTVTNFDMHRISGDCEDPETITDRKGEPRMRARETVWGPIYVLAKEHYLTDTDDGLYDTE